jgi:hypothetical protein
LFPLFATGVNETGGNFPPALLTPAANLPPVSLIPVSTTQVELVANLPPVSTTQAELVVHLDLRPVNFQKNSK